MFSFSRIARLIVPAPALKIARALRDLVIVMPQLVLARINGSTSRAEARRAVNRMVAIPSTTNGAKVHKGEIKW